MRLITASLGVSLLAISACIHRSPNSEIRRAFSRHLTGMCPTSATDAPRSSPVTVRVQEVMGNEAIISFQQDCITGSRSLRYVSSYLVVKHVDGWVIAKPLSAGILMPM